MTYKYTAYHQTEKARIEAIKTELLQEYPELSDYAEEIARMETPFGEVHPDRERFSEQENHINRLIDIIIVTENKLELQDVFEKACNELKEYYNSWQRNFTYSNPEEQPVYLIMESYKAHMADSTRPLITYSDAEKRIKEMRRNKDIQDAAGRLQYSYPEISIEIATKIIEDKYNNNIWLRFVEDDIVNLVSILKEIEDKEGYKDVYQKYLEILREKYSFWLENESRTVMDDICENVVEMMKRFTDHLENKEIPISTYAEVKNELADQQNYGK